MDILLNFERANGDVNMIAVVFWVLIATWVIGVLFNAVKG